MQFIKSILFVAAVANAACVSPRVDFTARDSATMMRDAYSDLTSKSDAQGIGYTTILAAGSSVTADALGQELDSMKFSLSENVISGIGPNFHDLFAEEFNKVVGEDIDRWKTKTVDEAEAVCRAAGIQDYPTGLFDPANQVKLREFLGGRTASSSTCCWRNSAGKSRRTRSTWSSGSTSS